MYSAMVCRFLAFLRPLSSAIFLVETTQTIISDKDCWDIYHMIIAIPIDMLQMNEHTMQAPKNNSRQHYDWGFIIARTDGGVK